jgi:hypothetical protein
LLPIVVLLNRIVLSGSLGGKSRMFKDTLVIREAGGLL